jgi:hypothetical protein
MNVIEVLVVWTLISVPVGLLMGRWLAWRNGDQDQN